MHAPIPALKTALFGFVPSQTVPVMVSTMINPNSISEKRSEGERIARNFIIQMALMHPEYYTGSLTTVFRDNP
jgi:hypothetical protein